MKVPIKLFIIITAITLSSASHAFPELPFCPAGGPPGWMNYFNDKRDQNLWQRYHRYPPPAYRQPVYYRPNYNPPAKFWAPNYNYRRNYYPASPAPYRRN